MLQDSFLYNSATSWQNLWRHWSQTALGPVVPLDTSFRPKLMPRVSSLLKEVIVVLLSLCDVTHCVMWLLKYLFAQVCLLFFTWWPPLNVNIELNALNLLDFLHRFWCIFKIYEWNWYKLFLCIGCYVIKPPHRNRNHYLLWFICQNKHWNFSRSGF